MKETTRLNMELAKLNNWKNLVVKSSLTPYVLIMISPMVNCAIDSVVASKKDTFLIN